ncbi:phosphate ABC transporter substrate-binding protein [candidate division KSB1 bacterium]|nr:phosphate ABC transporter substrate-binding protein [candidate division KSB1 bacterium]
MTALLACAAPQHYSAGTLRIKGSDTMIALLQAWAGEFMKTHAGFSVYVEGGGTDAGFQALINGQADMSAASRPMRPDEARLLAEKHRSVGLSILVAKDALSVYIHPSNPVRDLSLGQVRDIFSGKIKNWSIVGGDDQEISIAIRPPNSGTYFYFKEHVLNGGAYASSAHPYATTDALGKAVAADEFSIGYGGMAYHTGVDHLNIDHVEPTEANVLADRYPITRYLYLYTINTPFGKHKHFIDWVLSPEGQKVVRDTGYFPIWEKNHLY